MSVIAASDAGTLTAKPSERSRLLAWLRGLRFRQILSIPFWLAAFGFLLAGDLFLLFVPLQQWMAASRMANMLDVLGVVSLVLASRLGASTAIQLQALQPHRRPILYLRSFKADKNPMSTATDEELLSRIFRTAGPFVAFEEPGERIPEIGSAKMTVKNEEWRQVVSEQIQRAQFSVLNMGRTPSFTWEVKRVLELTKPERVLIYFSMHADEYHLRSMYHDFVEAVQPVLKHPLPPIEALSEQRFIRFDTDGRPELFGSIAKPGTAWRKWIGIPSFGFGLIVMRPFVVERWRHRMSQALAPLRLLVEEQTSNTKLWGRLAAAIAVYIAGLAALLPMLAWNYWHTGYKRAAVITLVGLVSLASETLNIYLGLVSFVLALIVYLAWPVLMPGVARRSIAFGAPTFGAVAATLAVAAAYVASYWIPGGQFRALLETDWAALL